MSEKTYKMTRLVGESSKGIEAAVKKALKTSAANVHGQTWAHVVDLRASLEDGKIDRWQATVDVAFAVDADSGG